MAQNDGDSGSPLTVDTAASAIEGLLSGDESEDTQTEDATPDPKVPAVAASEDDEVDTAPASEEESEGEEDDPADKLPAPKTYKVKVDGQDVEVPEDELVKGYSRQADYTRKTTSLSNERKAFETEANAVRAERQLHATKLAELDNALTSMVKEPDWAKLQSEDPNQFAAVHAAWQVHEKRLNTIRQERSRLDQISQADAQTQYQQHLEAENVKLSEAIPEWKDAEVSKKDKADLFDYATGRGFSKEELNHVADHRAIVMLRKAMLYDRGLAAAAAVGKEAKAKIEKVRVAAPGPASSGNPKNANLARAKQRLNKSGSVHDAAAALELMLG